MYQLVRRPTIGFILGSDPMGYEIEPPQGPHSAGSPLEESVPPPTRACLLSL